MKIPESEYDKYNLDDCAQCDYCGGIFESEDDLDENGHCEDCRAALLLPPSDPTRAAMPDNPTPPPGFIVVTSLWIGNSGETHTKLARIPIANIDGYQPLPEEEGFRCRIETFRGTHYTQETAEQIDQMIREAVRNERIGGRVEWAVKARRSVSDDWWYGPAHRQAGCFAIDHYNASYAVRCGLPKYSEDTPDLTKLVKIRIEEVET